MEKLLLTKQVAEYFSVRPATVTQKYIKMGLKYIPMSCKDYRFRKEDVEEFANHLAEQAQEKLYRENPIRRRPKCKKANIDFEKIRINRELNRVI